MKLTTAQLDEIEQAATKATPGRWQIDTEAECVTGPGAALGSDIAGGVSIADAIHIATMDPATTLALVAEVRELRADLAMLRDADQDASGRFAMSPHLEPKWHPKLRRLMRERDQARLERDDAKVELAATKRDVQKPRAAVERVRALHHAVPIYESCERPDCERSDCSEFSMGEYAHTSIVVSHACGECSDAADGWVDYPCDTIKVLEDAS